MRVLHILPSANRRGAQIFTSDLIAATTRHGLDQFVVVLRASSGDAIFFEAPTFVADDRPGPAPRGLPGVEMLYRLSALTRRLSPDVVVAHGGESLKHAVLARLGPPLVYRRIGEAPMSLTTGARRRLYAFLMQRASLVTAVADVVRDQTISVFGLRPERVITIPNGVRPTRVRPSADRRVLRDGMRIPQEAFVVLSLSALTWEKDPLAHIRIASAAIAELHGGIHLIAGDGPMAMDVRAAADSIDPERIRVLGPRNDVGDLLAISDVVLLASRSTGMEGMPAISIEAGMAGIPVAGYNIGGVAEVVIHNVTGLVVSAGMETELSTTLMKLARDTVLRDRLGAAASERCGTLFNIDRIADRYLDAYASLVPFDAAA